MTDKNALADKVREIITRRDLRTTEMIAEIELALPAPPRPTLAKMSEKERAACRWMQADVEGRSGEWLIIDPIDGWSYARLMSRGGSTPVFPAENVTPRPDLPRMEWPGTEKPAPAPALPDGWRLADHNLYGRVIVTRPEPDDDGKVAITASTPTRGYRARLEWCRPDELTYLDQEDDTSDTVPESTLAVGSEWEDVDALTRACEESGRDQIIVTDKDGDVSVWGADAGWWETGSPDCGFEPYTILHAGKEADQ